jgi:pimeloyl-ACP methyl ester carboxylesterase
MVNPVEVDRASDPYGSSRRERRGGNTMPDMVLDGVKIAFDDVGAGGPPLLFVHGWAGNRTNFAPQLPFFSGTHRVVSVDRRGHGDSAAPEQDYTVEGAADDLAALCRELGLGRAVVVQHSYDRLGFDFAARYPELVLALAILDGPTLAGPAWEAGSRQFLHGLESDGWRDAIRGFAAQAVFPPAMPAEAKERALDALFATPHHVLVSSWRSFVDYDLEGVLPLVRCPLLHVAGAFPSDRDRLRELCPQCEQADVRGRGHFIQLTAPDDVNAILAGFVTRVSALPVGSPGR